MMKDKPKLDLRCLDRLLRAALAEDIGPNDVTTDALVDPDQRGCGQLVSREPGVLAGMPVVAQLLRTFDRRLKLAHPLADGARLRPNTRIATITGPFASILTVERTALNFLQYLSGIATATRLYVDAVAGTRARILDTRKTLPGWRPLAKYAVAVGGGTNHRIGLYDQVLIKDNHLAASSLPPADAVAAARRAEPRLRVEVEIETPEQLDNILRATRPPDIVMLDNMPPAAMRRAVARLRAAHPRILIEASGGITLRNVAAVARTGVDFISIGAVTHSVRSLDIALDVEPL